MYVRTSHVVHDLGYQKRSHHKVTGADMQLFTPFHLSTCRWLLFLAVIIAQDCFDKLVSSSDVQNKKVNK